MFVPNREGRPMLVFNVGAAGIASQHDSPLLRLRKAHPQMGKRLAYASGIPAPYLRLGCLGFAAAGPPDRKKMMESSPVIA